MKHLTSIFAGKMPALHLIAITLLLIFVACSDDDRDLDKPAITADGIVASPSDCDSYRHGDTIHFCYRFTDNVELGNFNIEIHGNHDHHTHSTSAVDCPHDEDEEHHDSVNPWVFNQDYQIPAGTKDYVGEVDIVVPEDIDEGDYHFMIRLTDRAGWQELRSVAIEVE